MNDLLKKPLMPAGPRTSVSGKLHIFDQFFLWEKVHGHTLFGVLFFNTLKFSVFFLAQWDQTHPPSWEGPPLPLTFVPGWTL